jgi:gas vesicle protein
MCDCEHNNQNNSGFVFGLFIGAAIGAVIAIYIYKNNKSEIIDTLKNKLGLYVKKLNTRPTPNHSPKTPKKSQKISVVIPENIETLNITPVKTKKKAVLFKK